MADSTPSFLVTRILGITTSAFLSGFAFSASYYTVPAISIAPLALQFKQWQVVYDLGKLVSPPLSAAGAAAWGYAAWHSSTHEGDATWKLYSVAAALTLAILVWTVAVMMPTNKDLMKMAKIADEVDETEAKVFAQESVKAPRRWNWMNFVRAVLPMIGTVVGLIAAIK